MCNDWFMGELDRLCAICGRRRAKRFCIGLNTAICSICCGTEREVSIRCPLECSYLHEAHRREAERQDIHPRDFPYQDIKVTETFLQDNEPLLILLASSTARSALTGTTVDDDVRQALDALIRMYRAGQGGIIYDTRPQNPLALTVFRAVEDALVEVRARLAEEGLHVRDADVLGILAFLQRLEIQHNNGRRQGRAFIDFLRGFFPPVPGQPDAPEGGSLLIMP